MSEELAERIEQLERQVRGSIAQNVRAWSPPDGVTDIREMMNALADDIEAKRV